MDTEAGGTFADPQKATNKGRWDGSENPAGTPNQTAFKLSVGGQQQLNSSQKYIIFVFKGKLKHFLVILVASLGGEPNT